MPPPRFKLAILMATSIVLAGFMLFDLGARANLGGKFRNVSTSESWDGFRSWEQLRPSRDLVWRNCAPGRQCARLIVPLDYSNQDSGGEAVIALVRKPAVVPKDSKLYRGPILFNPGGPGASGVDFIIGETGDLFSTILGPEFDLIGFDPRGIARSIPRVSFFKTDIERSLFDYVSLPLVNGSDEGIHRTLARAKIVGQLAAEADSGYLRHINTDYTARDMLRIVEAHGRSKLQYWGFSYGTVLGATFAAMFPVIKHSKLLA
ncbi:Carboxylesterase A [Psilocybe cubensis]|uniref:Carboxylesterase A n=2 Tax=Psilocybe cubensis TaxID=181762 RepID=A0ACB8H5N2_PSICU|nr:Carboxylesterase A [Psilocybe cubensis]KAH9483233.1 Carboxylesterase A [Psilocybe cubensis]